MKFDRPQRSDRGITARYAAAKEGYHAIYGEGDMEGSGLYVPDNPAPNHRCKPPKWWFEHRERIGWRWLCECGEWFEYRPNRRATSKGIHVPSSGWAPWWRLRDDIPPVPMRAAEMNATRQREKE